MSEARNETFRQLKPVCVGLNQAVLAFQGRSGSADQVVIRAQDILSTLRTLDSEQLNPNLAEYAFVPLSYILRSSQQLPIRASEIVFKCLALLIQHGWREQVAGPLGNQLLILLAITADKSAKAQKHKETTQELLLAIFDCLTQLFHYLSRSENGKAQLTDASAAPHLGHAVTVLLEGISSEGASATQLSAARALTCLVEAVDDHEALASFLPGIVSGLTKVLTPTTQIKRNWQLLEQCLKIMTISFRKTVSDKATTGLSKEKKAAPAGANGLRPLNASWLEATAGQLKLALANINKQRSHERLSVRKALAALDMSVLRDCAESLSNCRQLCMENLLVLLGDVRLDEEKTSLTTLMNTSTTLCEALETTLRDWSISLPRILEGSDEDKKTRRLQEMFTAYHILKESGAVSHSLQQLIAANLPDYVSIILRTLGQDKSYIAQAPAVRLDNLPLALRTDHNTVFPNAVASVKFQAEMLTQVQQELSGLATSDLAESFASLVRQSTGDMQVSTMWLSLNLTRAKNNAAMDALVDFGDDHELWRERIRDDLYDFSLTTIDQDDTDWRIKALSLEVVAEQAVALGSAFRNELIDALYPVLHLLGGETPRLRQHAMVCLNIISRACGFSDVKELVVANADYLVNAVALRLNSFDVSPQGPQVLLMMVNLAGPSLVPYLEDTVESIFAILEDYHGYTTLVQLLFSVLNAIGEQGVQESRLQIEAPPSTSLYPTLEWQPMSTLDLATHLQQRLQPRPPTPPADDPPEEAPEDAASELNTAPTSEAVTTPPPPGKTFPLLLRIAQQTQHHLPSSSSSLRHLLLAQLATLLPCIAKHEDSFLPLINTLWPDIVPRLADTEDAIVRAALDVLTLLCRLSGGFLKSRIRTLWPSMSVLKRRVDGAVAGGRMGREVAYVDPSAVSLRTSFREFLTAVVAHVGVDDEIFDEVLEMAGPEAWSALEPINADAVWLARRRSAPHELTVPGGAYAWARA